MIKMPVATRSLLPWVLGLAALVAGCKGDAVQCEQGCRNYGALVFWKNAETQIAAAPAAERDALRKTMADKFKADLEGGISLCVSQCQSANNTSDTECMINAKTGDQALACFK
jgi:hypothetical protein